jgi:tetratricopeptide (TPR) repeat protein
MLCVSLGLGLAAATAALYAPVRHYDFLFFDDWGYVTKNPLVAGGLTREGFIAACTTALGGNWHPLTVLSHMLDCQLFGLDPGPHHLGNVVLHVFNTLLLFGVLVQMTAQPWRCACTAALFALHPLHIESVAWIAERKDVLSTLFALLTLQAYVAYVRHPRARTYALLLGAYVAALLSKPMVVTLPFLLLLLDVWPLRRIVSQHTAAAPQPAHLPDARRLTYLVAEKLPLLLLAAMVSAITLITQAQAGATTSTAASPLTERAANAAVSYATYLVQTFWPANLAIIYPFQWRLPIWQIAGSVALLIGVTGLVFWGAQRHPYVLVGWLWYLGSLVPAIGLVRMGTQARADRFTYVPLIGIFIIIVWGIPDLLGRWKFRRVVCTASAVVALAACTAVSAYQLRFWRDSMSLFQHAVAVTPRNYLAHFVVGKLAMEQGASDEAFSHMSEVLRIANELAPNQPFEPYRSEAQCHLGLILAARGDLEGAKRYYQDALQWNPLHAKAHAGLGSVLRAQGNIDGAVAEYREAVRLNPDLAAAHTNLAITLEDLGHTDEAIVHYTDAVRLEPQSPAARLNLGGALASTGRLTQAIEHFRAALALNPQSADARVALTSAEARAGHAAEPARGHDQ